MSSLFKTKFYVCDSYKYTDTFKCESFNDFIRALKYYDRLDEFSNSTKYIRYHPARFPLNLTPHCLNTFIYKIVYMYNTRNNKIE